VPAKFLLVAIEFGSGLGLFGKLKALLPQSPPVIRLQHLQQQAIYGLILPLAKFMLITLTRIRHSG
jgi:hypothetical protein